MRFTLVATSLLTTLALSTAAMAADVTLTIKDHQFTPKELTVPANEKITLTVKNEDSTPAEFESHDLKREKVIKGNSSAVVKFGPLKPGSYNFVEEFHEDVAKGVIIAK